MNKKMNEIRIKPVRYYKNKLENYKDAIDLTVGEGHFESPFNAKMEGLKALIQNETKYGKIEGDLKLREKLINKYYPQYDAKMNITIHNGSTQGLFSVLMCVLNRGDEVILISPHYPLYEHLLTLLEVNICKVHTDEFGFKITPEKLNEVMSSNTKAVIINEPCNPTGIVYSLNEKKQLLEFFRDKNMLIIVDEIYRELTTDTFISFSHLLCEENQKLKKQFIFINGLSKSHLMTGYRIGYVVCDKEISELLKRFNYLNISCVSTIMQKCAIGALEENDYCNFVKEYYLNNVKILKKALEALEIPYVHGEGAYYVFMDISDFQMDGRIFCQYFVEQYHVALVPGELFDSHYQQYVRVSCCKDINDIICFVDYLKKFINIK